MDKGKLFVRQRRPSEMLQDIAVINPIGLFGIK
jgi:hypothetical protein